MLVVGEGCGKWDGEVKVEKYGETVDNDERSGKWWRRINGKR